MTMSFAGLIFLFFYSSPFFPLKNSHCISRGAFILMVILNPQTIFYHFRNVLVS